MSALTLERLLTIAQDDALAGGTDLLPIGLKRQDTLATDTSADGDAAFGKVNALGELYSVDESGNALLTTIDADTGSMVALLTTIDADTSAIAVSAASIDVDTSAIAVSTASIDGIVTALSIAEDSAAAGGEQGIQILAVRQDVLASSVSADGDFGSLKLNALGELHTTSGALDLSGLVADDAPNTENPLLVGFRAHDAVAALSALSADGDKADGLSDLYRRQFTNQSASIGVSNAALVVGLTEVAIAATQLSGRIEVMVQNSGNQPIYLGGTGVTTATGIEVSKNSTMVLQVGEGVAMFAISGTAGQDVRVMELA